MTCAEYIQGWFALNLHGIIGEEFSCPESLI